MIKPIIAGIVLLLSINSALASIDVNVKYGQKSSEVSELQEFLISKSLLTGNSTGFFGFLTLKAVKAYQVSQKLPATGFVGPMTRESINREIDVELADSNAAEVIETGTTTPLVVAFDACKNIEGNQSVIPTGMWNNGDGVCYVPVVNTSSVNYGSVPAPVVSAPVVEVAKPIKYFSMASDYTLTTFSIHSDKEVSKIEVITASGIREITINSIVKENTAYICRNNICGVNDYKAILSGFEKEIPEDENTRISYRLRVTDKDGVSILLPESVFFKSTLRGGPFTMRLSNQN